MAKAHQPLSRSSHQSKYPAAPLTVEEAAGIVVRLINERPQSPRQDEIAAVIASVVDITSMPRRSPAVPISDLGLKIRQVMEDIRGD
jgi:hypothetical protein